MEREKCLWCCYSLLFTLLLMYRLVASSQEQSKSCSPSHCGTVTKISHPFRLQHDPPECGDKIYELTCEHNTTFLQIYSGKYRVLGIDYNKYKIQLVDSGIKEGDCSTLPDYILSRSNFSDTYNRTISYKLTTSGSIVIENDYDSRRPYKAYPEYGLGTFGHVVYLKCREQVKEEKAYLDTFPCVNREGGDYMYAVVGDLSADLLTPECSVKMVTAIASNWRNLVSDGRMRTYSDVHNVTSFGFELSWRERVCVDFKCPQGNVCFFTMGGESPICLPDDSRDYKLLMAALEYGVGIYRGLLKIVGKPGSEYSNESQFNESNITALGILTGRFVLPFITVRFLLGIICLIALLIYTFRRRHLSMFENIEDFIRLHNLLPLRYSYKDLKTITEGFKYKLGEGGFGTVYKGKLKSGIEVAVKMLGNTKSNGQDFISEVATIGKIHHFNVVHLMGFCVEGTKRALLYEFMPRGSLDKYIFSKEESLFLSYRKIYEMSLGVARGIAYLHHGCNMKILHFDIKPHNILLDDNFIPKISDFGLAKSYSTDNSIVTWTTRRGTAGYMAPELIYNNIGGISHKADVYSFGMLLMEMASRRRNFTSHAEHSSQCEFPLWIYDQFDEQKDIEFEDLMREEKDLVRKMFIVALWCIQFKPIDRPSMNKVIELLEVENVESLEMPPKPYLYPNEAFIVDEGTSSYQTTSTISMYSHRSLSENSVMIRNNKLQLLIIDVHAYTFLMFSK